MRIVLFFSLLLLAGGLLLVLLNAEERNITEPPPATPAKADALPADLSYISLPLSLSYAELARYANQRIPVQLVKRREHKRYTKRALGIPVTFKGRLNSLVKRTGPVTVGRHKDMLAVHIPLRFELRFKGSDALDPDIYSKGRLQLRLRLKLGMTPAWQPTLKVYPSYQWQNKPRLKLGPFRLDAREILGEVLDDRLKKLSRELERDVRQSAGLRDKAVSYWHELHQLRQLGGDDTPAWLMVDPQAAYFAPLRLTDSALQMEFALAASLTTLVGEVPPPPLPEPLPALRIAPPPSDGFNIQLPVSLNYAGLEDELQRRYANQALAVGKSDITPHDFRIYSSGQTLVLGARVSARMPGRLFNSRGWLYLQGRPVYTNTGSQLSVQDFDYTRQVDNWLVSSATWVLHENLRKQLANALQFDFSDRVAAARASIHARINRPLDNGFKVHGRLKELSLGRIQPRAEDLLLLLNAQGQLAISAQLSAPDPDHKGSEGTRRSQ